MKRRVKIIKAQNGGQPRLVKSVPTGYIPMDNKPNYWHNPQVTAEILGTAGSTGSPSGGEAYNQKLVSLLQAGHSVDELVKKGYGTAQGLAKFTQYYKPTDDVVYTQPDVPATPNYMTKSMDDRVYYPNKVAAGDYSFNVLHGDITNPQSNSKTVSYRPIDKAGNPTGDYYQGIPEGEWTNSLFSNQGFTDDKLKAWEKYKLQSLTNKKYGGRTGDQRGYALHINHDINDVNPNPDQTLNKFIKAVPREEANIEAEKGETVLGDFDKDGELEHMDIGGKRHFNGGTPINVPKGAFIFSDTAKMKLGGEILKHFGKPKDTKKKYTPADLAKQYDLNKFKDKMKVESTDKIALDTAELMMDNNKKKLGKLAFVQEALKGFPTGVPGIIPALEGDDQDQNQNQQMRYGGIPKAEWGFNNVVPYKKSKTKAGQITPTGQNNTYSRTAQYLDDWEKIIPGIKTMDNATAQDMMYTYMMKTPEGRDNIRQMWNTYGNTNLGKTVFGSPKNGKFSPEQLSDKNLESLNYNYSDGFFGVRTLDPNKNTPPAPDRPMYPSTGYINPPKPLIPNIPGIPDTTVPDNSIPTGNPNFYGSKPNNVNPNGFDVMGLLHAATRPIDHIRPSLFRTDAQVTDPTLMDNTAEIQQLQSVAKSNNDVIQNTANGQVARSNISGNVGRLFDPINQSNMQTNNANISIINGSNQNRDQVMNQKAAINLDLLSKFTDQNNVYKANLSKEKQMKFADTQIQGQNMVNNMITLGSVLQRSPNFKVDGPFWNNVSFVPGQGDLLNNGSQTPTGDESIFSIAKKLLSADTTGKMTWADAISMAKESTPNGRSRITYDANSNTPKQREYTTYN